MNVYLGPVLILVFLGITCLYSAFEKIFKWTDSLDYYINLYDKELSPFLVKASIVSILLIEIIVTSCMAIGIYDLLAHEDDYIAQIAAVLSAVLFIFLMIGMRIIKEYEGAARILGYFLLSAFCLYWIQSI